jgi:hypothetical protein
VIARRQLETRALELRIEGHTLESIAHQLGLANRGAASKYIARVLDRNESESVAEYRYLTDLRLSAIAYALWPLITGPRPSLRAIDRWLKIQDRIVALHGLNQRCSRCGADSAR